MIIPHRELTPEALQGLIEEFVTRDGTDYGEWVTALETKVAQVWRQLDMGTAVIGFYEEDGSSAPSCRKTRSPRLQTDPCRSNTPRPASQPPRAS